MGVAGIFDHALSIKTWWDLCTTRLFLSEFPAEYNLYHFCAHRAKMALLKHVVSWLNKLVILVFIVLFITSGLVLNVLQIFLLPLYWINRYTYRILNAKIVYFHWARESALYLHENVQIGMIPIHSNELYVHLSAGRWINMPFVNCRYETV